jgi:hypothetical protein
MHGDGANHSSYSRDVPHELPATRLPKSQMLGYLSPIDVQRCYNGHGNLESCNVNHCMAMRSDERTVPCMVGCCNATITTDDDMHALKYATRCWLQACVVHLYSCIGRRRHRILKHFMGPLQTSLCNKPVH